MRLSHITSLLTRRRYVTSSSTTCAIGIPTIAAHRDNGAISRNREGVDIDRATRTATTGIIDVAVWHTAAPRVNRLAICSVRADHALQSQLSVH